MTLVIDDWIPTYFNIDKVQWQYIQNIYLYKYKLLLLASFNRHVYTSSRITVQTLQSRVGDVENRLDKIINVIYFEYYFIKFSINRD